MANKDRVNGFWPVRHITGAPYNGQFREYSIPASDSTAVFKGDLVKIAGGADAYGRANVAQAAASNACVGVVVGFAVDPTNLNTPQYRAASTLRTVYVADDPNLIFEGQTDAAIAAADNGLNCDFTVAAGNTTTGTSGMEIDGSEVNTTPALPIKLLGSSRRTDNEATLIHEKFEFKINNHQYGSHTGTAGIA